MMRIMIAAMVLLGVSGCVSSNKQPVRTAGSPPLDAPAAAQPPISSRGLEAVMGKDSAALTRLFGTPRLNVKEVNGRKLQFAGTACILDAYLYPDGQGGAEIVTHVDARRRDGAEVDRAACVNALQRK